VRPSVAVALAPQPTPIPAPAIGPTSTPHRIPAISGGQLSGKHVITSAPAPVTNRAGRGTPSGKNAPPRSGQRKLTFLLALPAILLLLPLFVLPFVGRRRYY
jgi:hypothetical protein